MNIHTPEKRIANRRDLETNNFQNNEVKESSVGCETNVFSFKIAYIRLYIHQSYESVTEVLEYSFRSGDV